MSRTGMDRTAISGAQRDGCAGSWTGALSPIITILLRSTFCSCNESFSSSLLVRGCRGEWTGRPTQTSQCGRAARHGEWCS